MSQSILLEHIEDPQITTFEGYRKKGGYASVEKAIKTMSADQVIEEVKTSGLRGRGGASFSTGMKWSLLDRSRDKPRYLVCNADESEPGTFKDRFLMQHIPHRLIEGMIVSSFALGSRHSYIYIRGELMGLGRQLQVCIAEAYANGFLGEHILGSDFSLDIYVHPGAGAYICGEETALLESLEGKRGNPRIKPPFSATVGLYGCPTVVNNVETLAAVPWIVMNGGEAYSKIGIGKSTGTKLISACGHVKRPGVYEIDMGLPIEEFVYSEAYCGGIKGGRSVKAIIPGGSSAPILPAHLAFKTAKGDTRLFTYESLMDGWFDTASMLGSGGFIVMDDTTDIVRNTWNFSRFYHHESCGQCSPCREGTGWLEKILHRLSHGCGKPEDIDTLFRLTKMIEGKTICSFGEAAAWPVASALHHFREEFMAKVGLHA